MRLWEDSGEMCMHRALIQQVPDSFEQGQTTVRLGQPSLELARRQHEAYGLALQRAGLEVLRLPANHDYSLPRRCRSICPS